MKGRRWDVGRVWPMMVIGTVLAACEEDSPPVEAPELELTPLVLVSPDGIPFGRIADIELGADGSLYVLDAQRRTVRVFDQQGIETGEFGGAGGGPGEFGRPVRLLWRPGGELWVLDLGNARLASFDSTGELIETHPLPDVGLAFPLAVGFASPDTLRWVGLSSPDLSNMAAAWAETTLEGGSWVSKNPEDLPFVQWPELFTLDSNGMVMVLPVPFSGEPQFEFDHAGRFWYATTASPTVSAWSPGAGLSSEIEVDASVTAVTPEDVEEALAEPDLDELRALGDETLNRFSGMIPGTMPPLAGFFFGEGDQVWVVHGSEPGQRTRPHVISMFDAERRLVGTTQLEVTVVPLPRVRGGVVATVVRDELGVESVRLYRIGG